MRPKLPPRYQSFNTLASLSWVLEGSDERFRFTRAIGLGLAVAIALPWRTPSRAASRSDCPSVYPTIPTGRIRTARSIRSIRRKWCPSRPPSRRHDIVDTQNKFIYFTLQDGLAIRYGVGVGREGFGWSATVRVGAKQEWPTWTPPPEMIERRPELWNTPTACPAARTIPLGARAMYLFNGNRDTMFRIHGTNEPWSIGQNVSSGCIRMLNEHVTELYRMVTVGTKVIADVTLPTSAPKQKRAARLAALRIWT